MQNHNNDTIKTSAQFLRKIYLSLYLKGFERVTKGFTVWGELEAEQDCNILTPTLMAITAFLSRSPGLLNWGPEGPASLGHVPHSSIFSPTDSIFRSPRLYNNLTSTLLHASVTISHSIQPLDSQGYILIFLCYLHRCVSYFDILAESEVNIQH